MKSTNNTNNTNNTNTSTQLSQGVESMQKGRKSFKKPKYARKHTLQLVCAVVLVIIGSGLLISGFIVPPAGEIHPSVLIAFGEILTFVGALFGIDYHYKYRVVNH